MDPITIWTALGVIVVVAGGIINTLRSSDKAAIDNRFTSTEEKINAMERQLVEKAHKDEVARIEARMDKEFESVRAEQRSGFADLKQDIKDMRIELMAAIKDMVGK
ncbi:hypothetical protein [Leptothrix discophora]|uniref:Uncharacterized protein n=1 Tax=Leptothrix discophora TaxID=89 RepID=A0ABT9G0B3_LEPDI|nr:hypothetical protein [Leptothrix discophora]MDP4299917.1 hypothetical protein [Leptothrix discophora]